MTDTTQATTAQQANRIWTFASLDGQKEHPIELAADRSICFRLAGRGILQFFFDQDALRMLTMSVEQVVTLEPDLDGAGILLGLVDRIDRDSEVVAS